MSESFTIFLVFLNELWSDNNSEEDGTSNITVDFSFMSVSWQTWKISFSLSCLWISKQCQHEAGRLTAQFGHLFSVTVSDPDGRAAHSFCYACLPVSLALWASLWTVYISVLQANSNHSVESMWSERTVVVKPVVIPRQEMIESQQWRWGRINIYRKSIIYQELCRGEK